VLVAERTEAFADTFLQNGTDAAFVCQPRSTTARSSLTRVEVQVGALCCCRTPLVVVATLHFVTH
jgi:hypothetical protein